MSDNDKKVTAQIIVKGKYTINLIHYKDVETIREALEIDKRSLADGIITLDEIIDVDEADINITIIP